MFTIHVGWLVGRMPDCLPDDAHQPPRTTAVRPPVNNPLWRRGSVKYFEKGSMAQSTVKLDNYLFKQALSFVQSPTIITFGGFAKAARTIPEWAMSLK